MHCGSIKKMVPLPTPAFELQDSSSEAFEKDVEIHALNSDARHNSGEDTEGEEGKIERREGGLIAAGEEPDSEKNAGHREGGEVIARTSTRGTWKDPGPPPDGGMVGWTQGTYLSASEHHLLYFSSHNHQKWALISKIAVLGHLVIMNTWGFINSFGVFQTYYTTALHEPPSAISWIGSIQVFLLFSIGTLTGRLSDAGYFRPVFLLGTLLGCFGVFMSSLSTTYWQLLLAQGVCCGLGFGCLFCPSLSILSTYFSTNRSLAIGIAAAGSATGGMIFPAMVQQLLPRVGFPWTMRALGFIQLGCLAICNIGIRPRVPPRKAGALVDWKSFKETSYVLFAVGMFFVGSLLARLGRSRIDIKC